MRLRSLLVPVACALAGCRSCQDAPTLPATSAPGSAPATPSSAAPARHAAPLAVSSASAAGSARPTPPAGGAPVALDEAGKASAKAYLQALGQGRALTRQKKLDEARAAFDRALKLVPDDARALAERGFVRLQGDDVEGAEQDFFRALDLSPDRPVLSAVTYNLSLVAERRHQPELAEQLRAAARSASGRAPPPACNVRVERDVRSMNGVPEGKTLATLAQVRAELSDFVTSYNLTLPTPLPTTTDEGALRAALFGALQPPWLLDTEQYLHLVFQRPDGRYLLYPGVASPQYYRCGSTTRVSADVTGAIPSTVVQDQLATPGMMCQSARGDQARPCGSAGTESWEPVQSFCTGQFEQRSWVTYFDRTTGLPLLQLYEDFSSSDFGSPVTWTTLQPRPDGVQLLGNGCNELVKFTP